MTIWRILRIVADRPVLWLVGFLHLVTGIMLTLDDRVALVTGLRLIAERNADQAGLIFIAVGLLSLWAMAKDRREGPGADTFWCLITAQALLFIVSGGVIYSLLQGHYASGTVLPRSFIFTDQLSKLLLMLFHPLAVYKMHRPIIRGNNDAA